MSESTSYAYTAPFFVNDLAQFQEEISQYGVEIKNEYDEIRLTSPTGEWENPTEVVEIIQRHISPTNGFVKVSQVETRPEGFCIVKSLGVLPDGVMIIDSPDYEAEDLELEAIDDFFSDYETIDLSNDSIEEEFDVDDFEEDVEEE